ncbi:glycosyltransferase family 2 protein [Candidatus Allofournierella merdipullorum]|uniref:glycosyltransferase family 2 protein n=1 Tax=Candidatus Allofournierella merdipullorum TaxID=2838595 RepID=UPI003AB66358
MISLPAVSIIIPVFRAERFLARCLRSVAAQTFTDWECLLIDDGSPDQSVRICREFAAGDDRFILFQQENQGPGAARNAGLRIARGEFVLFLDSDDLWPPYFLQTVLGVQAEHPNGLIVWSYTNDPARFSPAAPEITPSFFPKDQIGQLLVDGYLYYVWNKLFRLDLIRSAGLAFKTDLHYGEDLTFCMEYIQQWSLLPAHEEAVFCPTALYYYETGNEASITSLYKPCYCEDEIRLVGRLLRWFTEDFPLQGPPRDALFIQMLQTVAGGLSVDLAQPDGYALARRHLACPTVQELLRQAASLDCYTPFLFPMRRGWVRFSGLLGRWKLADSRWYHRVYWAGYRLNALRTGRKSRVIL